MTKCRVRERNYLDTQRRKILVHEQREHFLVVARERVDTRFVEEVGGETLEGLSSASQLVALK